MPHKRDGNNHSALLISAGRKLVTRYIMQQLHLHRGQKTGVVDVNASFEPQVVSLEAESSLKLCEGLQITLHVPQLQNLQKALH